MFHKPPPNPVNNSHPSLANPPNNHFPSPKPMSKGVLYGLHAFTAENDDEMSFVPGELIEVIEKDDLYGDGWWQVGPLFPFDPLSSFVWRTLGDERGRIFFCRCCCSRCCSFSLFFSSSNFSVRNSYRVHAIEAFLFRSMLRTDGIHRNLS